ncbi:MAG: ABC transporter ATP-binding protein [Tissierellales bacterium]|jgi:energy-coupling factor transport system ATP-binding protein|nr:ABC transporter ATP-binding protein [Tissierellales bacterium]
MISFENVEFRYKGSDNTEKHKNLSDINLKIPKGQVVLLCGKSGCGKTTITRLINGLVPHFYDGDLNGKIKVSGMDVRETDLDIISKSVGSVFQNPRSQFFNVDTADELAFGCENRGMPADQICERINSIIKPLNLEHLLNRSLFELSGGEKQRIACGSVGAMLPEILVLDEPSSNLDISSIGEMKNIISKWKSMGKTIVIAEHRLHYLMDVADRVIYMADGFIKKDISVDEFQSIGSEELHDMGLRQSNGNALSYGERFEGKEAIVLNNFYMRYGKRCVLNIENMKFPKGSIMAILGDNGAGKTTFVNHLCGLVKKPSGNMESSSGKYCGKKRAKKFFMVMQDVNHQLFTESVEEEINLSLKGQLKLEESKDIQDNYVCRLLENLNLREYYKCHPMSLSGGQKQRVAIACAMASEKDFLVFDEPTSGLDYHHMFEVSKLMKQLARKGKSIFIVTHDPELVASTCDHVCFLKNGELDWMKPASECAG